MEMRKLDDLSSTPEAELIRLARQCDEEAFRELFLRTRERCMRLAMSMLRDRDDARDEIQNAFLNAYIHLASFNENAKFSSWVARILINRCKTRILQRCRSRLVAYESPGDDAESISAHELRDTRTPEWHLGAFEVRRLVSNELQRIPGPFKHALELRFIQGLSPNEIAQRLNISISATKSRLNRAQKCLKSRLIRHCGARGAATLT